jgi:signal transduction histidine kinase/CheY-like chemotaxis protein
VVELHYLAMHKHRPPDAQETRERDLSARETAVASRETWMQVAISEHERVVADREEIVCLREEVERAHAEADEARFEREYIVEQMRAANEQLVLTTMHADELAEQARAGERTKDEFLAMLGHELRNPLAPIMTALELMALRAPDTCVDERALIERQVNHIVHLVDDLLDIARITGGKVVLHRERIELRDVITSAIELVAPLFAAKGHELVVAVPEFGLTIDADPARLTQVAANLLANAAKYTPSSGRISILGERRNDKVSFRVRDNGIGIAPEMLPRIFGMFTQETQALDKAEGGLGLGLAIVQILVSLHDGVVFAHSAGIGLGSEFVVELPASPEGRDIVSPNVHAEPQRAFERHKILVVDDNADSADLTAQILAEMGHEVRVAYDGPSALLAVDAFVPDIALLDIGLPGMNGYELAHAIDAKIGHIRFVAISGYGQEGDRERSRNAGFTAHLVKPVSITTLREAVR